MTELEKYLIKNSAAPAVKTVSGECIQIYDAEPIRIYENEKFDALLNMKLNGKTITSGHPSLEKPVELKGVNIYNMTVDHYGINIIPYWNKSLLNYESEIVEIFEKIIHIQWNKVNEKAGLIINYYNSNREWFSSEEINILLKENHFYCPDETIYVKFTLLFNKQLENKDIIIYTAPIEIASSDYEYKKDFYKILNDIELYDYDEIDFNEMKIKKYSVINKIDLDNGNLFIYKSLPNKYDEYIYYCPSLDTSKPILSNTLPNINSDEEKDGIFIDSEKNIHIRVTKSIINYLENTKILFYLKEFSLIEPLLVEGNILFLENVNYIKTSNGLPLTITYKINMNILTKILIKYRWKN